MRSFIGGQSVATDDELIELALGLGLDPTLWLGTTGESGAERRARLDAGADILADDPDLAEPLSLLTTSAVEAHLALPVIVRAVTR
ncbi:hypothetical protein [Streptomyces sp. NBRC 109706]|uniref:hypothetical protein n=1 Tax=Streptomyces sp. NBRC 109706 TaxID=1550035 RepID=UPI0007802363|nr:hypothetical protein [Streptomyces sp. NBRC 109706]